MGSFETYCDEFGILLRLLLPNLVQIYFTMGFGRMTLAFVGHYDPVPAHIGGAALGSMYSNVTGMSIGVGATLAVGTFCAQNHGRGASDENGIVLRHARLAQAASFAFAVLAAAFSSVILGALGQPDELLVPCQLFSLVQAIGYPAVWLSFSINSALNAQSIMAPGVLISASNSALNFLLTWGLLASGVGYLGVAIAFAITGWTQLAAYSAYVVFVGKQHVVWKIPKQPRLVLPFKTFVETGLPSALSMWVEWWACEILAIFAGLLPSGQYGVAANGILFNTLAIVYFTYVSTQVATSVRMGNLVGARDVSRIPTSLLAAVSTALLLSAAGSAVLHVFGSQILELYTSNENILEVALAANPGIVFSVPPYAVMMCLLGAMRSAGLQSWGAAALFVAFYLIGIPLGAYLGLFAGWDLFGIWMGNVTSLSVAAVAMSWKVCTVDWHKAVGDAMAYEGEAPEIQRTVSIDSGIGGVSVSRVIGRGAAHAGLSSPLLDGSSSPGRKV
eukprot:TRINITY_DN19075_c0_g3_i1.p1 TRINITY_DN19075_c0_g3~~TRINITY_DN19075_c0_g3_i1.p1  ORF type:complete len:503 (+),score=87.33 TRINITY_DN19075_c0_g3_i1:106-1614(+)